MVELAEFVENYRNAYIIADSTLNRLRNDQYGILTRDGQFRATFMYYFFLGRYFARNQIGHRDDIAHLCEECHVGINRLILLFITHHTNAENIIDEISLQTVCTTEDVEPAILDEEEQKRFFKILASIPKSILTEDSVDSQRRKERAKRDGGEDEVEELDKGKSKTQEGDINQIYRVLKCNQILGQVLRNKYGSLKKGKVEEIVEAITDGGLKLVNSVLKDENEIDQMALYLKEKHPKYKTKRIERAVRFVSFVWTMVNLENAVEAINVPEIRETVKEVGNRKSTPAYDLVGYFNLLDGSEELGENSLKELETLLSKHRNPFMKSILSLRTQHYMNTQAGKVQMDQRACSMLKIPYVHKGTRK